MEEESLQDQTCGKGLADRGPTIDAIATFADGMAAVLESHIPMLDEFDPASEDEGIVYRELVGDLRDASKILRSAGNRMSSSRDMVMGRHVDSPDANEAMARAFRRFVDAESTLVARLSVGLDEDRGMLGIME